MNTFTISLAGVARLSSINREQKMAPNMVIESNVRPRWRKATSCLKVFCKSCGLTW